MLRLFRFLTVSMLSLSTIVFLSLQPVAAQVDVFKSCNNTNSEICEDDGKLFGSDSIWNKILNAITYVGGAVAVLMIVIGGLRYTLSNGDQAGINSAKNTILYAVVGVVLMIMANAIINFVLINI